MARLQEEPIVLADLVREARSDGDGAVATFLGTVRAHNAGRRVLRLEYHAYAEMAVAQMRTIENEAESRFAGARVSLVHRTGVLQIGEASVAVVAVSPHRAAAFDACRWAIDTLKRRVPIWKKEHFEGGESWIEGPSDAQA